MRWRLLVAAVLFAGGPCTASAREDAASSWFEEALRSDAGGDARSAFALYRRAAEAGLPAAELNVAVMLDSGRGVAADTAEAATWYARAAVHGEVRAAYNRATYLDRRRVLMQWWSSHIEEAATGKMVMAGKRGLKVI